MSVKVHVKEVLNLAEIGQDTILVHGLEFVERLVHGSDTDVVSACLGANTRVLSALIADDDPIVVPDGRHCDGL